MEKPELPYDHFFSEMPADHIDFFRELKLYAQGEGIICVHAGVSSDCQYVENEDQQTLLWGQKDWWLSTIAGETKWYMGIGETPSAMRKLPDHSSMVTQSGSIASLLDSCWRFGFLIKVLGGAQLIQPPV